MKIKCERCGNDIDRSQLYIVIFHGLTLDVHTHHLCCKHCLKSLNKDLHATFKQDIIDKCISSYRLEIVEDIVKEGEKNDL